MARSARPPVLIQTDRLTLRCLRGDDAPQVQEAVRESLDHLRAFMPWAAREPVSLDEKATLLRRFHRNFMLGRDFCYGIRLRRQGALPRLLGCCGMHPRIGAGAIELGYWIRSDEVSRGYATEVACALTRVAFDRLDLRRVEIHCEARNLASAAVARKAGFALAASITACVASATASIRDLLIFARSGGEHREGQSR